MQKDFKIVVTDTSCFIILEKIKLLNILSDLFDVVYPTPQIAKEYGRVLPEWVFIKAAYDTEFVSESCQHVDLGEATAIALATEIKANYVIIDDGEARKYAEKIGMNVKGTLDLLVIAKQKGLVPALKPYLNQIAGTNFRVSSSLIQAILKDVGE